MIVLFAFLVFGFFAVCSVAAGVSLWLESERNAHRRVTDALAESRRIHG